MYNIGQFRSSLISSYSTPINTEQGRQQTSSRGGGDIVFQNYCHNLTSSTMNNINCYYLRFSVVQKSSEQTIYLKIRNTSKTEDNEQLIEEYHIPLGTGSKTYQVIISPNDTYNQILWELQRTPEDYSSGGRVTEVTVENFSQLTDLLKTRYSNIEYFAKIGIQGPPSLLMSINRQQIRLGRTGVYEINNGIKITSVCFMPRNNSDYFIMDFEY